MIVRHDKEDIRFISSGKETVSSQDGKNNQKHSGRIHKIKEVRCSWISLSVAELGAALNTLNLELDGIF
jgi:hypothetical protein